MKSILILGFGRSATALVDYLTQHTDQWQVVIADNQLELAQKYTKDFARCSTVALNVLDAEARDALIQKADLVLSMVPARFHPLVLESCIRHRKNLITPSYLSAEMRALSSEVDRAGILVLNEMGLDPGIDHMSAKQVIDQLKSEGNHITCFESFTGGLMAPGCDDNPWQYKFSWNPRNVVLAGTGGAVRFLHNGKYKYIPYTRLFRRTERIQIEGYGAFEGYANRDSLSYIDKYDLEGVSTIYRGTLRRPGFCRAWDIFVQLGLTDDSYAMEGSEHMTYREYINAFLPYNPHDSVELKLMHALKIDQDSGLMDKLQALDLFSDRVVGLKNATPAAILEHILMQKWAMKEDDKDMIVMWHKFFYESPDARHFHQTSALVVTGENRDRTAMAKTVGLPMAIAARLVLEGKLHVTGLQLPVLKEIYNPVLEELKQHGIDFRHQVTLQKIHDEHQPVF
jgi:saccharopine dehydrogenase (NAD+, L-glutamate forming)